jgi:epoxyqueuosine reductase
MEDLNSRIKEQLLDKGASLVGFADLSEIPADKRNNMLYGISIAVALTPSIVRGIKDGPTKEYLEEYKRVNEKLDNLVKYAGFLINESGYEAVIKTATIEVSAEDLVLGTVLPHKTVATRAGLGWIGKCALLVTEEFGSAVRLSSVLTNAPLKAGNPINESQCGSCNICTTECPASAPSGENWVVGKPRDTFFNAYACRKAALERATSAGFHATICGKCIEVCPRTRKYLNRDKGTGTVSQS